MMIIAYAEKDGQVVKRIVLAGTKRTPRGERRPDSHFSQTLLRSYYALECEQRFRSNLSKKTIKRAHETALQRFDHTKDTTRP